MGLFDKKFCDICGEKIGMLGNRKLEDGNMCKDCAKKLSPFCDDRRHSTLEQMKAHLQYREENKNVLRAFRPSVTLGEDKKIYIDMTNRSFVVSRYAPGKWDEENPDVMPIASITSCGLDIDEDRDEEYTQNGQGQRVNYNPPRYKYYYNFKLKFLVNNPYFDDFEVKLNNFRVEGMGSMEYNRYHKMGMDIMNALGVNGGAMGGMPMSNMGGYAPQQNMYAQPNPYGQPVQQGMYGQSAGQPYAQQNSYGQPQYAQPQQNMYAQQMPQQGYAPVQNNAYAAQAASPVWSCPSCGAQNDGGKFCAACGAPRG
ncbi:MAG: DUF4428 domain-containing protein [Clostridia bacterium]|nr:DUF4428 domain-containing protein [Clostridia bacterium]